MAVNAHDDEIDIMVRRPGKDNAPDISVGSNIALHCDLNTVSDKPRGNVGPQFGTISCYRFLGIYKQDHDPIRCDQKWQRLGRCARTLAAGVPAQHHRFPGLGANANVRNDKRRASGRNCQRFREVGRDQRLALKVGLSDHKQVGIAGTKSQLALRITLGNTPLVRQVRAFDGIGEGGGGRIAFSLRGSAQHDVTSKNSVLAEILARPAAMRLIQIKPS